MKNLHIITSGIEAQTRPLKIIKTLIDENIFTSVTIVGTNDGSLDKVSSLMDGIRFIGLKRITNSDGTSSFLTKIFQTLMWYIKVYKFTLSEDNYDCINAHSLAVLPLCLVIKLRMNALLVYDTHELETETHCSHGFRKIISRLLERILIKHVDMTTVVSNEIKQWYSESYRINSDVIYNYPAYKQQVQRTGRLRQDLKLNSNDILFVNQGALIEGRGIELLLNVFSKLRNTNNHIIFIGFGSLVGEIKTYAKTYENIHFHNAVELPELFELLADADIGIHLMQNTCLNHDYALPNKIFDYLNTPMPIVVSNLKAMSSIVIKNECGWIVSNEVNDIVALILEIDAHDIKEKKNKLLASIKVWEWSTEHTKIVEIYRRLLL